MTPSRRAALAALYRERTGRTVIPVRRTSEDIPAIVGHWTSWARKVRRVR